MKLIFTFAFLSMTFSQLSVATELEKLLMPGELVQVHADIEAGCEQCHEKFDKVGQNQLCMDCHDHKNIKTDISQGRGFHGRQKNVECNTCHSDHLGRDADIVNFSAEIFNHNKTDFILKGKHNRLNCESCHLVNKKFHQAPGKCVDCHGKKDPHKGKLGKKCADCHREISWNKIKFDHDKKTDFKLQGKHRDVNCDVCHVGNQYEDTPDNCYACHYVNDIHNGSQGEKCDSCHSEKDWTTVKFDHDKKTDFALKGEHAELSCAACHVDGYEQELKISCISCHKKDDAHKGQYGKKCKSCHSEQSWTKVDFNHDRDTKFDLIGLHKKLLCNDCHRSKLTDLKDKRACYDCHKSTDVHDGEQGEQCEQCHSVDGWNKELTFDHGLTAFPLMGQHAVMVCEECHLDQDYKNTNSECKHCHTKDDSHEGRFADRCERCHNPNDWNIWLFDHDEKTNFILDGAHEDLVCNDCHTPGRNAEVGVSETCEACHRNDDVHRGGFGRQCQRCHVTSSFRDEIRY